MRIESVSDAGRRKRIIVMENGESFPLSAKDVRLFSLREEADIDGAAMTLIREQVRSDCLGRCGSLLGSRDYTEARLRDKLREDQFPEDIIEAAVQQLREANYLNDERYADAYLRLHAADRSRTRIRHDLLERGVPAKVVARVMDSEPEEETLAQETGQAVRLLLKRGYDPSAGDFLEEQKHRQYLFRKGYSAEAVRTAMAQLRVDN